MTNKQKIIIGSVIGVLAIGLSVSLGALIGGAGNKGGSSGGYGNGGGYNGNGGYGNGSYGENGMSSSGVSSERDNILVLARRYIERGEYERAMDLLDSLLIKNANDEDALALIDDVIVMRESGTTGSPQRNTDGTNSELQQALEEVAEANRATAAQNAAMQQLLKEQAEQEARRRELEQEKQRQEEAEKLAEKQRQERLAQEEANKRANEEALARKSREIQEQVAAVNDAAAGDHQKRGDRVDCLHQKQ